MTPHNEANINDVAKTVLMPGDPLRAKYIADNYLKEVKVINKVRNMFAYTGYYNDKKVTVFPSGMGMPSMGIYAYELLKFYDVDNIIRIGTCGGYREDLQVLDIILVDNSFTLGNFAYSISGKEEHICQANKELNSNIINIANKKNINLTIGNVICNEFFDNYLDLNEFTSKFPKDLDIIASEMESFALFYLTKLFNKKSSCLLTVVDSHFHKNEYVSSSDREVSLNKMIELALDAI